MIAQLKGSVLGENTTHETGKENGNGVVQEDNLRLKDQHEFWNESELNELMHKLDQ